MTEFYSKKNLFLPGKMLDALKRDATRFEAFAGSNGKLNMNRFLSHLIAGYYSSYTEDRRMQAAAIRDQLKEFITDTYDLNTKTAFLLDTFSPRAKEYNTKGALERVSYKPTTDTYAYIDEIEHPTDFSIVTSLSQYLRNMFASYLSLPIYEREKIIFKESVDIIEQAIAKGQSLRLEAISSPRNAFHVIPYKLVHTSEEMFNYLLCQSYNTQMKKITPFNMRLCRIKNPIIVPEVNVIEPEVLDLLELMVQRTPQYPIYKNEETCVLMTEKGNRTFSRIYFGRPDPVRMPEKLPNGKTKYYFNHAEDQLYFYFRRFEADEAIVLYPEALASKIKAFHENAWKTYENGEL